MIYPTLQNSLCFSNELLSDDESLFSKPFLQVWKQSQGAKFGEMLDGEAIRSGIR